MTTTSLILKFIVLALFASIFFMALRRHRVYIVPLILMVYSNINGLLGWEDFALKGLIKFQDYGLLVCLALLFLGNFALRKEEPDYMAVTRSTGLYNAVNAYWFYYIGLFILSVFIQGEPIWPIKMGRVFFYGLVVYIIYRELIPDPLVNFERVVRFLMWATLVFGVLYILYNLGGWEAIYPKGEHEILNLGFVDGEVKRNFSGFPTFTYFFVFYFTDRLLRGEGNPLLNLLGIAILSLCILLMLTRGTVILTAAMSLFLILYRKPSLKALKWLFLGAIAIALLIPIVMTFSEGYYLAMTRRFAELSGHGLFASKNYVIRIVEFERIVKNVIDFDPLFGFGFTNVWALGYTSSLIHGGSADNGFSNLIGTTGFVGIGVFTVLIGCWLVVNVRLQMLNAEHFSKINFVFIWFMLGSFMNGASMSYMHSYALFMAYDLLAYGFLVHRNERSVTSQNEPAVTAILAT